MKINNSDLTLVLLNYNNYKYLKSCIDSVEAYGLNYSKIIFIDDYSTDVASSVYSELIEAYPKMNIVSLFNQKNMGVTKSLLNGLNLVSSKYVQVLATDDLFGSNNKPLQEDMDELSVYISSGSLVDESGNIIGSYKNHSIEGCLLRDIIYYSNPIKAPGFIASKKIIRESLKNTKVQFEDWPLLRYAVSIGGEIKNNFCSEILYRQHSQSLSSKKNFAKKMWMTDQILIFLNESKKFKTSTYTSLMILVQINWLMAKSGRDKYIFSFIRYLDFRRVIYFFIRLFR